MKDKTGIRDYNGRPIIEGDVLSDNVPSKGIVMEFEGSYYVTSDYDGKDIRKLVPQESDLLNEDLVYYNRMVVIGNIHDDSNIV